MPLLSSYRDDFFALLADVPETKLLLGKSLNPDNIRESSDVYYDCLIDANPPIYKVEWRHNVSINVRSQLKLSNLIDRLP